MFEVMLRLLGRDHAWQTSAAAVVGWTVAVASNFALHERVTFRDASAARPASRWHRLGRYYLAVLLGLGLPLLVLNALIAWVLPHLAAPHANLTAEQWSDLLTRASLVAGIGVGTLANFWMARRFVFR